VTSPSLERQLGVPSAVFLGLGSIIGTGVFVSTGLVAGIAGAWVVAAVAVAALVATCNAMSSAQLAAVHPVSGGSYEYGYRLIHPAVGFTAGWMFLCAKSASAATAALGFGGYLLNTLQIVDSRLQVAAGAGAVAVLTLLVAGGLKRSNTANTLIVSATLASLLVFVIAGIPSAARNAASLPLDPPPLSDLLRAVALMFVAYTGYGRIATMGEEVRDPRRTIPRAIVATLVVSSLLYLAVSAVGVGAAGPDAFYAATQEKGAPLEVVARGFGVPGVPEIVALGAVTAMLGVLLNLILGLSRMLLAMGRRGDMPAVVTRIDGRRANPTAAVIVVGAIILAITLIGSIKTAWSFSAFTVLVYYSITNLAALRLPLEHRLYPRAWAYGGLFSCVLLAFWVEPAIWMVGLGLIGAGLLWYSLARRIGRRPV
jgi:APA family basic amino acid/polyamine antiporter